MGVCHAERRDTSRGSTRLSPGAECALSLAKT